MLSNIQTGAMFRLESSRLVEYYKRWFARLYELCCERGYHRQGAKLACIDCFFKLPKRHGFPKRLTRVPAVAELAAPVSPPALHTPSSGEDTLTL
jgi:hypothetical protein